MHNQESLLENETHKLLWHFEMRTDDLILARRPDIVIVIKKRTCQIVDFAVPADHRVKLKESEKNDKYLELARELKNTIEHASDDGTSLNLFSWYNHQRRDSRTGGHGNKKTRGDQSNYSIIEIGHTTETCPGDMRKRNVTQTLVGNHRLSLV